MKIIAKGSQNGAEIDAKTHQKSMPELVSKKIREITKNHVSLKSEIIEIHWKNNGFWWFRRLGVRTVKVSKKHQKWDQIPSEIQWKIDTKKHARQNRAKIWKLIKKVIQKWNQNPSTITPKIDAKKETKKEVPNLGPAKQTLARSNARDPQTQSFQKTSFGVRCEENKRRKPTEGWVQSVQSGVQKVKCKGKVQKGKCRQATKSSAERQVQTGNPQRT